jgi:hypothetical protein
MMLRNAASKVMWVGRATVFLVGLSVILALVFGAATVALGATGGNFILGKANSAGATTKLTSSVAGATLQLVNNGTGTALNLSVPTGKAPLTVNSTAGKATNPNADKLDGMNSTGFLSSETYNVVGGRTVPASTTSVVQISCDAGDLATSGGYFDLDSSSEVIESFRDSVESTWVFKISNIGLATDFFTVQVACSDLRPLR